VESPKAFCSSCRHLMPQKAVGQSFRGVDMIMSGLRVRGCAVLYRHGDARCREADVDRRLFARARSKRWLLIGSSTIRKCML